MQTVNIKILYAVDLGVLMEVEGFSNQIIGHTVQNGLTILRLLINVEKKSVTRIELHSAPFDLFICLQLSSP